MYRGCTYRGFTRHCCYWLYSDIYRYTIEKAHCLFVVSPLLDFNFHITATRLTQQLNLDVTAHSVQVLCKFYLNSVNNYLTLMSLYTVSKCYVNSTLNSVNNYETLTSLHTVDKCYVNSTINLGNNYLIFLSLHTVSRCLVNCASRLAGGQKLSLVAECLTCSAVTLATLRYNWTLALADGTTVNELSAMSTTGKNLQFENQGPHNLAKPTQIDFEDVPDESVEWVPCQSPILGRSWDLKS